MQKKKPIYKKYRPHRTGEDIDMLREREIDPQSGNYGSKKYKDHIDGAWLNLRKLIHL